MAAKRVLLIERFDDTSVDTRLTTEMPDPVFPSMEVGVGDRRGGFDPVEQRPAMSPLPRVSRYENVVLPAELFPVEGMALEQLAISMFGDAEQYQPFFALSKRHPAEWAPGDTFLLPVDLLAEEDVR